MNLIGFLLNTFDLGYRSDNCSAFAKISSILRCSKEIRQTRKTLKGFKAQNSDSTIHLIFNGPSLERSEIKKTLNNDITIVVNGFHRLNRSDISPDIYLVTDYLAIENYINEPSFGEPLILAPYHTGLRSSKKPSMFFFCSKFRLAHMTKVGQAIVRNTRITSHTPRGSFEFSLDPIAHLSSHFTVAFAAFQIALYLNYNRIYLYGLDLDYTKGHANPNYRKAEDSLGYTDTEAMYNSIMFSKSVLVDRGVSIYNCSPESPLNLFKRL